MTLNLDEMERVAKDAHERGQSFWSNYQEMPSAQVLALIARVRELEAGLAEIADGRVGPEQEGHYLAHRKAVETARALLTQEQPK